MTHQPCRPCALAAHQQAPARGEGEEGAKRAAAERRGRASHLRGPTDFRRPDTAESPHTRGQGQGEVCSPLCVEVPGLKSKRPSRPSRQGFSALSVCDLSLRPSAAGGAGGAGAGPLLGAAAFLHDRRGDVGVLRSEVPRARSRGSGVQPADASVRGDRETGLFAQFQSSQRSPDITKIEAPKQCRRLSDPHPRQKTAHASACQAAKPIGAYVGPEHAVFRARPLQHHRD